MSTLSPNALTGQAGMAQSQRAAQDVQEQSRQIDTLKRNLHPAKDKPKKLREACEGFESVFIQKMWEQMRATVPKGGLLQGRDEQYWQGMFDQELSKKMSSAGGIGLADMMYEQLSRNLVSASRTTASGLGAAKAANGADAGTGFVASAAPLLPPARPDASPADPADKSPNAAKAAHPIYSSEAQQPQGDSQNTDKNPQTAASTAAATPPPSTNPPVVQQVLDQLRAQMDQKIGAAHNTVGSTMTGAQAIAAVQAMSPAQALALSQGMSWAQVQSMHPEVTGQAAPTGLENARAAMQSANTRMPSGGVLPPMTALQRQGQMHYSAATVGRGGSTVARSQTAPPTATESSTMPINPALSSNVQGNPGVAPHNFVQNSALIPAAAPPPPMSMTAEQIAALAATPQAPATEENRNAVPPAGQALASAGPAIPPTVQEPQVINTTFTTNVPPARRNSRPGQRMPKGQPAIRTLNTGGQG
ncbi:MAG: rod-binding protein [Desulfovibrionaceae bacterium]